MPPLCLNTEVTHLSTFLGQNRNLTVIIREQKVCLRQTNRNVFDSTISVIPVEAAHLVSVPKLHYWGPTKTHT